MKNGIEIDEKGRPVAVEDEESGELISLPSTKGEVDDDLEWAVICLANARVKLNNRKRVDRYSLERLEIMVDEVREIAKKVKKKTTPTGKLLLAALGLRKP